jgi:hypothetical protein
MRKLTLIVSLAVLLLIAPQGCTTTIVPPAHVRDPAAVFVVPIARTSSLLLPTPDGQLARFVYGDWRYYALGEDSIPSGIRAMLWPTQGTLGRALLPGPAEAEHVGRILDNDGVHQVHVEREAVRRLLDDLNRGYDARRDTEVQNAPYGLWFVHQEPRYTYFHNSNHVVADWLRRLGCEVRGLAFGSRWRVQERE